jgi:hypothetical protein
VVGLSSDAFQVTVDGRTVRRLQVVRWSERFTSIQLTVLAEPDLLAGSSGRAMASLFESLSGVARSDDKLRLVTLADKPRSAQTAMGRAPQLADKFGELSDGDPGGRLYDALYDAMQQASGSAAAVGQAILLVTRGRESGSHHGPLDVLALSRLSGARVPVHVLFIEGGNAGEADRLRRLAEQSGGGFLSSGEGLGLVSAGNQLLARGRGTYLVEYDAPEDNGSGTEHALSVTVTGSAGGRTATRTYGASDVRRRPFWQGPLLWLIPLLALLAGGAFLATRVRARLFRLVVLAGPEKGCSYDVFGVPVNLGAAEGNDVLLVEPGVSRNHAVMERRGSGIELMDLNSENGTFVNGERVGRRRLAPGDRIRLGRSAELRFEGRGS